MATAQALLTIEEYLALPDDGRMTELVEGRIIDVPPPGSKHGRTCVRFAYFLMGHVLAHKLGEVVSNDTGVITHRDPDSVRGADVAFFAAAKVPPLEEEKVWQGYFPFPPDLVVEVRSPSDSWREMQEKATEYLAAGVTVVILIDDKPRSAHVIRADQPPVALGSDDELTLPDILPGFALRVGILFE